MLVLRGMLKMAVVGVLLQVGACSIYSVPGKAPAEPEPKPEAPVVTPPVTAPAPQPRPRAPSRSAAYQPLLAEADQAAGRGDYEQALALLERAQRIDPDNAEIYLGMAKTHYARGDRQQARATAERGLLYCVTSTQCETLRSYTH